MIAQCVICQTPKPIVDEEVDDNGRYGPCRSEYCEKLRALEVPTGPLFNTSRLANDRIDNTTQAERSREIIETAKREGREDSIGRYRG